MSRPRGRRGPPPLILGPKRETIILALKAGNRLSAAARFAGVSPTTMSEWMRRGRGVDSRNPAREPYISFVKDVEQAQAEAEVYAMQNVRRGMRKDAKAAIWYLENVSSEWRRGTDSAPPAALQPAAIQAQNVILIDAATLQELATRQIRAERGDAELDDAVRARRARLVTESAPT